MPVTQLVQDLKYAYEAKYSAGKRSVTGQQSLQAEDAGLVPAQNKSVSKKLVEEPAVVLHAHCAHSVMSFCSPDLEYIMLLCWLFCLAREFTAVFITALYQALKELYGYLTKQKTLP